ncbi:putative quinol monooxygenase [Shimwellia blattae]|uniref:Quinol monooxygenase YgiN n=1 Tax=Shimwellia blattae (strain ATCC 29907 / DSM 4481 / JCM 1650 / NBRC 105725 / CDC 9005-74) TaxID=630626 RepID=I2B580_SHIBC|nr:putative quinol monooxygenase [Shimwellia blattae]AFJ45684.1 quinol monooxygenase YgiN [Shimwellia blattae DSM 4481 = NBRC 105725]GAB82133.1 putative quinol monooxygenase YgiN [Shimwellia blattae DSM 4481 = NBRC 105725]VDY63167.1 Probable quinol monooxygenase ygiN [Shimwellia blattae]VEC20798.1 Probable quinol monooxygenase ygiN [Shimwellia blattae]
MLTVIAEIRTRPGLHHRQAVVEAIKKNTPTVLKEAGCHGYTALVDHDSNAEFQATAVDSIMMVEKWESVAHLQAHLQTPHMKAFSEATKDDVLDLHIRILEEA